MARGLVIAAPHSGSGKTLVTLGLCRALVERGIVIAPAKSGPDYIDPQFLARAAGTPTLNLDAWAMPSNRIRALAGAHARDAGLLIVEGVMGLFDGAMDGRGSTADLAAILDLPVILVIDVAHMAQSVAAIAEGFARFRSDVRVAGVILNRVASERHEVMLRAALGERGIACFGAVPASGKLGVPQRHLGLVQPSDIEGVETLVSAASRAIGAALDIDAICAIASDVAAPVSARRLPPLGQHMAIARDAAFGFAYEHWLRDWRDAGAQLGFFSPLANEQPEPGADAVFLPGGYPELHAAAIANAGRFRAGLLAARDRGAIIYGECGGYMVLGRSITTADGATHAMTGLLPHNSAIDAPRRSLGYRQLRHQGPLPFARSLRGHEFHYSSESGPDTAQLFSAADAGGARLRPMGSVVGKVCGSYAHVIDGAEAGAR